MLSELGGNMNKRIKELYAKANAWALHNYPPPVNPFEWEDLRSKKFAELIVRECVTIINHGIDHTDYPHPNDTEKSMIEMKAQMWCRDAIKEHFGLDKQTK
jgi:hypothetical protein